MSESWSWVFTDAYGKKVRTAYDKAEFASEGDAETWLGENWREVVSQGVHYANLTEQGNPRVTYSLPLKEDA